MVFPGGARVIFSYLRHLDRGDCHSNRGDEHCVPGERAARGGDHLNNTKALDLKGWDHAHRLKLFGLRMTFFGALAELSEIESSESGFDVARG